MEISVGKAIKIIREARGQTLGALAREVNVSVPYLSLIEGGKRNPSIDVIRRLSHALETPTEVFLVIASGSQSSLRTSSDQAGRLVSVLREMEKLEGRIRDAVTKQGCQETP